MLLSLFVFASLGTPIDASGVWEVQSLGGDRMVRIEQTENELLIYRVLYPDVGGERYRLEHLYRGTIDGESIRGTLSVRSDEAPKFERLREFTGSITAETLVIDRLPLKRVDGDTSEVAMIPAAVRAPAGRNKAEPHAPNKPGRRRHIRRGKTKKPRRAPTQVADEEQTTEGEELYERILQPGGETSRAVPVEKELDTEPLAQSALQEGQQLYRSGQFAAALEKFENADELGIGLAAHKWLGMTKFQLGRYADARVNLAQAARVDPVDPEVNRAYQRALKK